MKKLLATILAAILCLMAFSALAEDSTMNCLISEESFVVQIDDPEGDLGWMAESKDESIVNIYDADLIEDTYVVRFDPVADGNAPALLARVATSSRPPSISIARRTPSSMTGASTGIPRSPIPKKPPSWVKPAWPARPAPLPSPATPKT